jgi:hypothetical protein
MWRWQSAGASSWPTFQCSSKFVVPNTGAVVLGTTLNAEGYSTKYVTSSVIKPQP